MKTEKVGISFVVLLQLAFIVLKLCGVITCSWLWVLFPLWMTFIVLAVITLLVAIWTR